MRSPASLGGSCRPAAKSYSSIPVEAKRGCIIRQTLIKSDVFNCGQIIAGAPSGATPAPSSTLLMDYYIAGLTAGATKG